MDERSRVALATLLGATIGGILGCLYLTEGGRRVRAQIEPLLDDVIDELRHLRGTVDKAREAAREGRRSLDDLMGGAPPRAPWESGGVRRSSG